MTNAPITVDDVVEAARALGVRDVVAVAGRAVTLRTVLRDAQRMRWDAVHVSVALDALFPRPGCAWRPVCWLCVDSLDVALIEAGVASGHPDGIEAHRFNRYTDHDTGCCSFCGAGGPDTLVAAVPETVFADPPARYLESRRGYADRGGAVAAR